MPRPAASFICQHRWKMVSQITEIPCESTTWEKGHYPYPAARTAPWETDRRGVTVAGVGAAELLQGPLAAFFASRQCPGTAIRAATDWALQQARGRCTVIGGFHSPLEQSVLRLLVEAGGTAVVVLARPVADASLRSEWRDALAAGRMAVISRSTSTQRLTEQAADDRNELAARLADWIAIAQASPGGQLSQQCARWQADRLDIRRIGDTNAPH